MARCLERGVALAGASRPGETTLGTVIGSMPAASAAFPLLLLFLLVLYTSPGLVVKQLAAIGPAQIVGGLAILALAAELIGRRKGFTLVWPESHLLLAFTWVAGLSCFTAVWARLSTQASLDLVKYGVIYFVVVNTVSSTGRMRAVITTMVIGGLVPALGTIRNYMIGEIHPNERVHWIGIFANSNDLAYSMVLLVPLAAWLATRSRLWVRVLLGMAILAYIATIYVTFSRGGLLGLLAVLLLFALRQKSRTLRYVAIGLVCASVVFVAAFWTRSEGFTNLSDFTFRQRLTTIRTGIDMLFDRPFLGVGLGGSVAAFPMYAPPNVEFRESLVTHNTLIQAFSEVGFIGGGLFTAFVISALYAARRRYIDPTGADEALGSCVDAVGVSLWGFVVCGLFGPYLLSWFPYILIGLVSAARRIARAPA
jgi:O-antigen ligase